VLQLQFLTFFRRRRVDFSLRLRSPILRLLPSKVLQLQFLTLFRRRRVNFLLRLSSRILQMPLRALQLQFLKARQSRMHTRMDLMTNRSNRLKSASGSLASTQNQASSIMLRSMVSPSLIIRIGQSLNIASAWTPAKYMERS